MQAAAVCFSGPLPIKSTTTSLVPRRIWSSPRRTFVRPKAVANTATESLTVDYNSSASVFPVEACDVIGGDACVGLRCPEAKLVASPSMDDATMVSEEVERDYLEYNQQKTVFPEEACDDLGGEFCEADYQKGGFRPVNGCAWPRLVYVL